MGLIESMFGLLNQARDEAQGAQQSSGCSPFDAINVPNPGAFPPNQRVNVTSTWPCLIETSDEKIAKLILRVEALEAEVKLLKEPLTAAITYANQKQP